MKQTLCDVCGKSIHINPVYSRVRLEFALKEGPVIQRMARVELEAESSHDPDICPVCIWVAVQQAVSRTRPMS